MYESRPWSPESGIASGHGHALCCSAGPVSESHAILCCEGRLMCMWRYFHQPAPWCPRHSRRRSLRCQYRLTPAHQLNQPPPPQPPVPRVYPVTSVAPPAFPDHQRSLSTSTTISRLPTAPPRMSGSGPPPPFLPSPRRCLCTTSRAADHLHGLDTAHSRHSAGALGPPPRDGARCPLRLTLFLSVWVLYNPSPRR
jgi:hypothetical protein